MGLIPSDLRAADDLLDPVGQSGDAGVDAVVIWTAAAFAPAHHSGQEPAPWRLLADQGPARVPLAQTVTELKNEGEIS